MLWRSISAAPSGALKIQVRFIQSVWRGLELGRGGRAARTFDFTTPGGGGWIAESIRCSWTTVSFISGQVDARTHPRNFEGVNGRLAVVCRDLIWKHETQELTIIDSTKWQFFFMFLVKSRSVPSGGKTICFLSLNFACCLRRHQIWVDKYMTTTRLGTTLWLCPPCVRLTLASWNFAILREEGPCTHNFETRSFIFWRYLKHALEKGDRFAATIARRAFCASVIFNVA